MKRSVAKKITTLSHTSGWSMAPLIKPGCRIKFEAIKNPLHLGDIVLYCSPKNKKLIAHRIISKKNASGRVSYLLKGDNNHHTDGWHKHKELLGKVQKIIYPGYGINLMTPPHIILGRVFLLYSLLNWRFPGILKLINLSKIPFFQGQYRRLVRS